MPVLEKRWEVSPLISQAADQALSDFPPLLRQILYNRGYSNPNSAYQFLFARVPEGSDPFRMLGIPAAVDRLDWAIGHRERMAVYGDYDADGVTATALMVLSLQKLGADVVGYIPNRFDQGYGLNKDALSALKEQGIGLVVTVDCGIRSIDEAEHARSLNLDLIITDHHNLSQGIPCAVAIINPKQVDDPYPEKDLAGVGLAYKLSQALISHLTSQADILGKNPYEEDNLDLVALGTVADLVDLVGENRSLVRRGLELIRQQKRQGIRSLIGASGLNPNRITATDIGFILGPRLNAAGRLDSALDALALLTSNSVEITGPLAQKLDNQNRERQKITQEILATAEQIATEGYPDTLLLFAAHPEFNPGVVGLAASRLSELYYRPAIIGQRSETTTRASCRSIPEFHITHALDQCSDLLEHHGGHSAAAGFTVKNENLDELLTRLKKIAADQLTNKDLRPTLGADAELPLSDLRPDLLPYLDWLQPTGYGNSPAIFVSRNLKVIRSRVVGKDGAHLKLTVSDGRITYDAIAFKQGQWLDKMPSRVDLMYTFEANEYNGQTTLQLNVRDIKAAD